MARINKNKSFNDYWEDIDKNIKLLESDGDEHVASAASRIKNDISELKKAIKGIQVLILWLAILSVIFAVFFLLLSNNNRFLKNLISSEFELRKDSVLGLTENDSFTYRITDKGKIISYSDLLAENDSLELENIKIKSDLAICNMELKFAKSDSDYNKAKINNLEKQNETYKTGNGSEKSGIVLSDEDAKKIDSAFVLLNVFRKQMTYDPKTKTWSIKMK